MQINSKGCNPLEHQDLRNKLKESTQRRLRKKCQTGNKKQGWSIIIEAKKRESFKECSVQGSKSLSNIKSEVCPLNFATKSLGVHGQPLQEHFQ